jgi:hypothetical protein
VKYVDVHTQKELDEALAKKAAGEIIVCRGDGLFVVKGSASVQASGSASVRASGSASVQAWGSASVQAWDSASVQAWDSASVRASKYVATHRLSPKATVQGGVIIEVPPIDSPEVWLEYHGVEAADGIVTLYKAVDDDWHTRGGYCLPDGSVCSYEPGTQPAAADFNPAPRDCGAGLHGCPTPGRARGYLSFDVRSPHYIALPVLVSDLGNPKANGDTGKIRFRGACAPCYEVDVDGRRLDEDDQGG